MRIPAQDLISMNSLPEYLLSCKGMRQLVNYKMPGLRIALFGCLLLAASCRQAEAPEYYGFQDIRIGQVVGKKTTLSTTLKFYNPNPFSLQLKRAEVDVKLNAIPSGHSLLDSTILIPQKDTFYVPVSMQVDLSSILSNALSLLLDKDKQINVTLDGRVKLKKGWVSFSRPFHYEGKQDLNELLSGGF
jgi:LEA14-like dessication related protein